MNRRRRIALALGTVCIAAAALLYAVLLGGWYQNGTLVLLVADEVTHDDPRVQVWLDAGREEGLLLRVVSASEFLRPWFPRSVYSGVILPDQVHRQASDYLTQEVERYVQGGGHLMLVYDAATHDAKRDAYAKGKARLSNLVGVDYALYDELAEQTIRWSAVIGEPETFARLGLPPGKYTPIAEAPVAPRYARRPGAKAHVIAGYRYPVLHYPSFATRGDYDGQVLLRSLEHSLVAGDRQVGRGSVLFVNLPLGYLKGQTDGSLLHGFLSYYADTLDAPRLAAVPQGVGGLVVNWHLDSNAALPALKQIERLGVYGYGPYSIHVTAGPDARAKGDALGIDIEGNDEFRAWLQALAPRHAIGSHGGWMHDYFARHLPAAPSPEFEQYLAMNKRALEITTGRPVVEYSAPDGNQPEWVTRWLEQHGIRAYYFTGNVGMGPTRSYREGRLAQRRIWSFPISCYRGMAGLEELKDANVPPAELVRWLGGVVDFVAQQRAARLVYFHPPGLLRYEQGVRDWLAHVNTMLKTGRFRLYTMAALAEFLNRRDDVQWRVRSYGNGIRHFAAEHPDNLVGQTWLLPHRAYLRPIVAEGRARITEDAQHWIVESEEGRQLRFHAERRAHL